MTLQIQTIRQELDRHHDQILKIKQVADEYSVTSSADVKSALNLAFQARSIKNKIEETRKEVIEPARSFINMINKEANRFEEILSISTDTLVEKVSVWKENCDLLPIDIDVEYKTEEYTLCERKDFEIVIEDISLIPREYLQVNEALIKAVAKAGVREIPGIRIQQTTKSYLRAN